MCVRRAFIAMAIVFSSCRQAAPKVFVSPTVIDEGVFKLSLKGKAVGQEHFRLEQRSDGLEIVQETELSIDGQEMRNSGRLRTDKNFKPIEGQFTTVAGTEKTSQRLSSTADSLELAGERNGKSLLATAPQKSVDLFVGNNMLAQLAPLCVLADVVEQKKTAFPNVPILIRPLEIMNEARRIVRVKADFASSVRLELICEKTKVVFVRQPLIDFEGTRVGFEAVDRSMANLDRPQPSFPTDVQEVSATVESEGARLSCTLALPKAPKNQLRPAAILLSGSGPCFRNLNARLSTNPVIG